MVRKKYLLHGFLILGIWLQAIFPAFAGEECGECRTIEDFELEEIRGGYSTGDGLEIFFGIEKSVLVNGVLQAVNTITLPQPGTAAGLGNVPGTAINVMQNGAGNSIAPSVLSGLQSGVFNFVQNSLDRAVIQNVTEVNASVTVLNLYRNMNIGSMLNQQLIHAMR